MLDLINNKSLYKAFNSRCCFLVAYSLFISFDQPSMILYIDFLFQSHAPAVSCICSSIWVIITSS